MRRRRGGALQRGVGIVELMVALTVGALVMLGASAMLLSTSASYARHAAASRLNDNGLYALESITRALRQTALINWHTDTEDAPVDTLGEHSANISGLDARTLRTAGDGIDNPLTGSVNGSDVLAVRYFGIGSGAGGDGSVLNCAGFGVASAASESGRGWSIFYVATDSGGEAELRCKYRGDSGWGADAIVRGVDSFQVLYGLDTDAVPDGVANGYVNASTLDALDAALLPVGADAAERERDHNRRTHWKRVVSIRIGLLLHDDGTAPAALATAPATPGGGAVGPPPFDLFGKAYGDAYGAGDHGTRIDAATLPVPQQGRSRRVLGATILLRNQAH
jgi:type IV pilus assembly protein PilW